ncbi:transposase-like protein [Stemphylium lycopersici]|uniref:Transposase-like protein n=1 Tax=Stemphylium lycopersici TaxID=183478 RepID=A0A364MS66_STELY|nr:transposase-like protein [Stemphylium lycopersici]RAQ98733.1 transposase-like protein [Stemphylium lycopersici]RAR01007.1 transposase-like protein [Stemphylium lycopersici]
MEAAAGTQCTTCRCAFLELRNPITRFMRRLQQRHSQRLDDEYNPLTDEFSSEECEGVQQLVDFLQAPMEMTKRLDGNNSASGFGSLGQTITNLQALWKLYSSIKAGFNDLDNSNSDYCIAAVKHSLEKLSSYFGKLIMEPERAKDSANRDFEQYIAKEMDDDDTALPLPRLNVPGGNADLYSQTMAVDLMFFTGSKPHKCQKRTTQLEEYSDHLRDDLMNANKQQLAFFHDPWCWWLEIGRNKYPVVFKITTDYLSIPATSCECERSFSTARRTITSDRNSLSAATIEALQP